MSWCPVCKNEYKDGIEVCADCGAKLVDSLDNEKKILIYTADEQVINRLSDYLKYSEIPSTVETCTAQEGFFELYVTPKYEEIAKRATGIFIVQEGVEEHSEQTGAEDSDTENTDSEWSCEESSAEDVSDEGTYDEEEDEIPDDMRKSTNLNVNYASNRKSSVYQNCQEKAEDFKSSGIVLLIVGIAGILVISGIDFGILPIRLSNIVMINIIMNALFAVFIVFGVYSLKGARKYEGEAVEERNTTKEIKGWALEHLKPEEIDEKAGCDQDTDAEEIMYFKRYEYLKKVICDKYANLDEDYLENLVENLYQELYEA